MIPENCLLWFDGCNICNVFNGSLEHTQGDICLFYTMLTLFVKVRVYTI